MLTACDGGVVLGLHRLHATTSCAWFTNRHTHTHTHILLVLTFVLYRSLHQNSTPPAPTHTVRSGLPTAQKNLQHICLHCISSSCIVLLLLPLTAARCLPTATQLFISRPPDRRWCNCSLRWSMTTERERERERERAKARGGKVAKDKREREREWERERERERERETACVL